MVRSPDRGSLPPDQGNTNSLSGMRAAHGALDGIGEVFEPVCGCTLRWRYIDLYFGGGWLGLRWFEGRGAGLDASVQGLSTYS